MICVGDQKPDISFLKTGATKYSCIFVNGFNHSNFMSKFT